VLRVSSRWGRVDAYQVTASTAIARSASCTKPPAEVFTMTYVRMAAALVTGDPASFKCPCSVLAVGDRNERDCLPIRPSVYRGCRSRRRRRGAR